MASTVKRMAGAKSPTPVRLASPTPLPPKLVRQLSVNSTKTLELAFAGLDRSKSGFITAADAKVYFESVVKACDATESAAMMMAEFDENSDNKITFDEWCAFFKRIQVPEQKLETVLTGMGFGGTAATPASPAIKPTATAAAANNSAAAAAAAASAKPTNDYKSPAVGAGAKSPVPLRLASPTPLPPKLVRQLSQNSTQVLEVAFAKLDRNKSGVITAADAKRYFESVVKACDATESAAMMMAEFDENSDNKITFDEWCAFFKRIQVPEQRLDQVLSGMGF